MQLERWRIENGLTFQALGKRLSTPTRTVTPETARRWCLPVNHPLATLPSRELMVNIFTETGKAVQPNDFMGLEYE